MHHKKDMKQSNPETVCAQGALQYTYPWWLNANVMVAESYVEIGNLLRGQPSSHIGPTSFQIVIGHDLVYMSEGSNVTEKCQLNLIVSSHLALALH